MIEWAVAAVPLLCAVAYAVKPTVRAARVAVTALGLFGLFVVGTAAVAFAAVRGAVPEERTALLSKAVAESINSAAFFALCAAVWAVPMFVGRHRRLGRRRL